jgi:hypothetical protein
MPQRAAVGHLGEREHLLDPAVTVGGDDEDPSGQLGGSGFREPQHHVVVELALGPVRDQLVCAVADGQVLEERAEDQVASEALGLGGSLAPLQIALDGPTGTWADLVHGVEGRGTGLTDGTLVGVRFGADEHW